MDDHLRRLPVEKLDLIIRTYLMVKRLDVATVGDLLGTTSAIDIAVATGSDWFCVDNLVARLAAVGVEPAVIEAWQRAPARRPIPALGEGGEPWGLLFSTGDPTLVVEAIHHAYREAGLVPNSSRADLLDPPPLDTTTGFGPDHLIHYRTGHGMVVVLSQRFELVPPLANPLAEAISSSVGAPIYAFRQDATEGMLGAYRQGRLANAYATTGATDVPELDLTELPLNDPARQNLASLRHTLPAMLRLLGIRSYGHRHAQWDHFVDVHTGPDDVDTSSLLAFSAPG